MKYSVLLILFIVFACKKPVIINQSGQRSNDADALRPKEGYNTNDTRRSHPHPPKPHNPQPPPPPPQDTNTNILYLVFDGGVNNSPSWNVTNLLESGLTTNQINWIVDSTQRAFNAVDQRITVTADPDIGENADPFYTQRTYITQTNFYGYVGGVSYIGSFNWGNGTPNFVFSQLLNYNESYIQRAITHEDGHGFGLQHDSCGGDYGNSGNWMGAGYGLRGFFNAKLDRSCTLVDQPAVIRSKLQQ